MVIAWGNASFPFAFIFPKVGKAVYPNTPRQGTRWCLKGGQKHVKAWRLGGKMPSSGHDTSIAILSSQQFSASGLPETDPVNNPESGKGLWALCFPAELLKISGRSEIIVPCIPHTKFKKIVLSTLLHRCPWLNPMGHKMKQNHMVVGKGYEEK